MRCPRLKGILATSLRTVLQDLSEIAAFTNKTLTSL